MLLELGIEPRPKERPDFNRKTGKAYTPTATKRYERALADLMRQQLPENFAPYPGLVAVKFYIDSDYIILDVNPVERDGVLHLTGDIDNYAKSILDAGNGVLWDDDRNIVNLNGVKW